MSLLDDVMQRARSNAGSSALVVPAPVLRQTLRQRRVSTLADAVASVQGMAPPRVNRSTLSTPEAPTTSWPMRRVTPDPASMHRGKYPKLMDRGAAGGVHYQGPSGTLVRRMVNPLLAGLDVGDIKPGRAAQQKHLKGLARQTRLDIVSRIRVVRVTDTGAPGGLAFAQAVRVVPDTPSQNRGTIRDLRPRVERGLNYADSVAPVYVSGRLAMDRLQDGTPAFGEPPASTRAGETVVAASSAPSSSMGLVIAAAVALFLFR